ncbi:response regulator transcription factor [Streptomyces resistomycificus]|uniref:Transcriptional regulator n=1 Tax=Streptomyces resistomycificus TaxID=67356 RepID=A0A0L8L474_9ACTN|nr:response regulator transcription factor [Streptomyces resistomycificus]KOG32952.1 transcriptional regulator [Streptomyces resistomycificus]KUN92091.1 two-component system response regulator [Streptomyces resistomycificus]
MPDRQPSRRTPLRIVVADDNPVVRAGLTALLSGRPDITVVAEAADGHEACAAARDHRPDVVLLDVRMPGMDGLSALPHLVEIAPVLMLTYSAEPEIVEEARRRGAGGYLVHGEFTVNQLVTAVWAAAAGENATAYENPEAQLPQLNAQLGMPPGDFVLRGIPSPRISSKRLSQLQPYVGQSSRLRFRLSTREAEIMDLIASGMNNQQIAAACFISEKTVKNHINRIFAKLHSTSRSQAAAKWLGTAPSSYRGLG